MKHKVLGLVSGGKDSCFNLLHCVANGHDVVALATLTPEPGTGESLGLTQSVAAVTGASASMRTDRPVWYRLHMSLLMQY